MHAMKTTKTEAAGSHASSFMNTRNPPHSKTNKRQAAVKKEGDTKRVKAEPGTGGGGGGGGGGDDAKAGGGADADGVWDLT